MYVADYVLMEYGTGAIMAVPAPRRARLRRSPDLRPADPRGDRARPASDADGEAAVHAATACSSTPAPSSTACATARRMARSSTGWTARARATRRSTTACATGWSRASATGAARSRSSTATRCGIVPVPDDQLPVVLPDIEDYTPKGRSPLAAAEDWVNTTLPDVRRPGAARDRHDGHVRRLVLVLPALLRPAQRRRPRGTRGAARVDAGRPVHRRRRARDPAPDVRALLHQGARRPRPSSSFQEPFQALFTQGMVTKDGAKMSKSRGNVVSPAAIVERVGADTARCYILFVGPPDQDADWSDEGVEGVHRFLARLWRAGGRDGRAAAARASRRRARRAAAATTSRCCARRTGRSTRSRGDLPPLRLQHRDRRRDGAAQRLLARCATRSGRRARCASRWRPRLAAVPVRAARLRRRSTSG